MTGTSAAAGFAVWSIEQVDVILTAPDLRSAMTASLAQPEVPMGSFESDLRILETELGVVAKAFGELTDEQWGAPTLLIPLDEKLPHWTVFELAGHFDISIGLTRMLVADNTAGQVGRDRTSFFIFSRSEEAPAVYAYAYTMVEGKTPEQMPGVLTETFTKTIEESRAVPPGQGRIRLLRAHAVGRVRRQPHRRGGRPRARPHRRAWPATDGHPGGDCRNRRDPRRAAGSPYGARPTSRPRRRPGMDPRRLRAGRALGSPASPHRMSESAASVLIKAPELAGRSGSP